MGALTPDRLQALRERAGFHLQHPDTWINRTDVLRHARDVLDLLAALEESRAVAERCRQARKEARLEIQREIRPRMQAARAVAEAAARQQFEAWIGAPPYEKGLDRFPEGYAWPGQYRDLAVQLAWEAWQEAVARWKGVDDAT